MEESLIGALRTLTSLQRWNFLPRVDFWTEAENVAYVTHVGYAIGRTKWLNPQKELQFFLIRSLLKPFNKQFLSDIPVPTRDALRDLREDVWEKLVTEAATKTSNLFPRKIAEETLKYLVPGGNYEPKIKEKIETLLKYAQNMVAHEECLTNMKVFPSEYESTVKSIKENIDSIAGKDKKKEKEKSFYEVFEEGQKYFASIKRLKYLRRWNVINRNVESSVLSHTFMVSFLAFLFSSMCSDEISSNSKDISDPDEFRFAAILRALFHDIPETLTGDIPTPVKGLIKEVDRNILEKVEKRLVEEEIIAIAPEGLKPDFEVYNLFKSLDNPVKYSVDSLVKECDKLALVMECLFEKRNGPLADEMTGAYNTYLNDLLNSEWSYVREFCSRVLLEFPFSDSGRGI